MAPTEETAQNIAVVAFFPWRTGRSSLQYTRWWVVIRQVWLDFVLESFPLFLACCLFCYRLTLSGFSLDQLMPLNVRREELMQQQQWSGLQLSGFIGFCHWNWDFSFALPRINAMELLPLKNEKSWECCYRAHFLFKHQFSLFTCRSRAHSINLNLLTFILFIFTALKEHINSRGADLLVASECQHEKVPKSRWRLLWWANDMQMLMLINVIARCHQHNNGICCNQFKFILHETDWMFSLSFCRRPDRLLCHHFLATLHDGAELASRNRNLHCKLALSYLYHLIIICTLKKPRNQLIEMEEWTFLLWCWIYFVIFSTPIFMLSGNS